MGKVFSVWCGVRRSIILCAFAFAFVVPPIGVKREDSRAWRGKKICARSALRMSMVSPLTVFFLSFDEQLGDQRDDALGLPSTTMCMCGWVGNALDVPSASHSVQPWSRAVTPSLTGELPQTEGSSEKRDWLFLVAKQIGSISGHKGESTSP